LMVIVGVSHLITQHSTFRLREKQEERGSAQTLWEKS